MLVGATLDDFAVAQEYDVVSFHEYRDGVGGQDPGLSGEQTLGTKYIVDQVASNMLINSAQHIIQEVDVSASIHGSGECQTCLLSTRQTDTALADLCLVAVGQTGEVLAQCACLYGTLIKRWVPSVAEDDILANAGVHDPWALCNISSFAAHDDLTLELVKITKHGAKETTLSGANTTNNAGKFTFVSCKVDVG